MVLAGGTTQFDDDDIGTIAVAGSLDAVEDFVGDVGNGFDVFAVIIEVPFFSDDRMINLTHGKEVFAKEVLIEKFFVSPQIHIGLGTVLAQERVAVFDGVDEAGVDV